MQAEREAQARQKVEAAEQKKKDTIEKAVNKLGRTIPDNQVDLTRYEADKQWVQR